MDDVLKNTLTANLKSAKTEEAKLDALVLAEIAVIDCQHKTAKRVKELVEERGQRKWFVSLIHYGFTSGGFVVILKMCKALGFI